MALFKKKVDPITERTKTLNHQIAALEAEIQRLSGTESIQELADALVAPPASAPAEPIAAAANAAPAPPPPRLRSTAFPHKYHAPPPPPPAGQNPFAEPVFEEVPGAAKLTSESPPPPQNHELGVRKYDFASLWNRLTIHFRGPATSNPKLVNYLAAGSIQGLRPLRYEKRVARNRFIVLVVVLIAVLWGLIAVLMKRS